MNVLIAYASKTGTTAKCAKILKALVDDATLCDLTKEKPDLSQYNCVIVGGSIRMGLIHKSSRNFIAKNKETLMRKKCAFFICNCFVNQADAYLKKNIPEELLKKAIATGSFGGEISLEDQKGFDKLIMKMVAKKGKRSENTKLHTSSEAINKFAEKIK
ncbi:flavodoxin [Anaerovorax odorimutans]|uniref:Flavodoxin n=1 Tax=Anaerovorax odorimutans TaxID=109327 RepID=A0ABT1RLD3_9FIRM|nr:flavodoxin domain-containing protein [Anaerovorax odorimutans]MCQ4636005.1 flavodoxin [Anaerovorax odorimutans]